MNTASESTGDPTTELRDIYAKTVFRYGKVPVDDAQLTFILTHLPRDPGSRILDAGCGNGRYAFALAQLGYKNVMGVDLFEKVDTEGTFEYHPASVDRIPAEDSSFDFVYSNSVIYHLEDPADAIREFARVLKPGARLVATVHSKYSLFTAYNLLRMRRGKSDALHLKHGKFHSPFAYRKILQRHGFKVIAVDGYRLSFLAYPIYFRVAYRMKKYFGIQLPLAKAKPTSNALLRWFKSITAYHTVLVAEKLGPGQ